MSKNVKAININSVVDYLAQISIISDFYKTEVKAFTLYYRGEPDCYENVQAGIFRISQKTGRSVCEIENELIENAKLKYPEIVRDCVDVLDALVRLQHYLLPTRLLDVTRNPLIALFFACFDETGKNDEKNGRVLVCKKQETPYERIKALASLIDCYMYCKYSNIKRTLEEKGINVDADKRRQDELMDDMIKPHLFVAPQNNPRIRFQDGAFIFSTLRYLDKDNRSSSNFKMLKNVKYDNLFTATKKRLLYYPTEWVGLNDMFESIVFIVDSHIKKSILYQLDTLGINEASIYPEYEHQMKYIKKRYETKIEHSPTFDI